MVAISLYRGNLHRVPDVPRRWLMPRSNISLKEFRGLLRRRSKALSLLHAGEVLPSSSAPSTANTLPAQSSLPPLPPPSALPHSQKIQNEQIKEKGVNDEVQGLSPSERSALEITEVAVKLDDQKAGESGGVTGSSADCAVKKLMGLAPQVQGEIKVEQDSQAAGNLSIDGGGCDGDLQVDKDVAKEEQYDKEKEKNKDYPDPEGNNKSGPDEKEKRKGEVVEKLEILNEKKHNLVKALKLILSAEEELKRRSSMQPLRPSVPLHVDVSNDSGSMTRAVTPKVGSEANFGSNTEGGEADNASNLGTQSRQVHRMSNISPSAESALKRQPYFQHNANSQPSRSSALGGGNPLGFSFPGNQAQPSSIAPPASVPGPNNIVSSSSPAAFVGTSSLRDARHPPTSPWS